MFAIPVATIARSVLARSHPACAKASRLSTDSGTQIARKPNDSIWAAASRS